MKAVEDESAPITCTSWSIEGPASRSSAFLRYSTVGDPTGARRHWLIWAAAIPVALWALVRRLGLESGKALTT